MLGEWLDWLTQQWVKTTGRRFSSSRDKWLDGPAGRGFIGDRWLDEYARSLGAAIESDGRAGLLEDMSSLEGDGFSTGGLDPLVVRFYEHTSDWRLEVWSRWSAWARPFGTILTWLFSRRLQQFNIPLDPLETSRGMTSEVMSVTDPDGRRLGTAWQRTIRSSGRTVFGGYYGMADLPGENRPSVRVVFPLPSGSVTVFLRPENGDDGALRLVSEGSVWGEVGAYLVVLGDGAGWARRVSLPERFDVYVDDGGVLRADHLLRLGRWPVLRMHYRLEPASPRDVPWRPGQDQRS